MKKIILFTLISVLTFGACSKDDNNDTPSTSKIESITLDQTNLTLETTDVVKLTASILPADIKNETLTWTSSDNGVASVDQDGTVNANNIGKAIIVVKSNNNKTATCTITVTQKPIPITSIKLDPENITIHIGEYFMLKATALPENHTEGNIGLSVPDMNTVTIDNSGKITGVAVGEVDLTVYNKTETVKAKCHVTVIK